MRDLVCVRACVRVFGLMCDLQGPCWCTCSREREREFVCMCACMRAFPKERGVQRSSANSAVCVRARACGDAISRTDEGDMGHSILQKNMPDDEGYHCEPSKRRKLRYSPSAWGSCFHLTRSWPVAERKSAWTSWFQYLGVPIP